MILVIQQDTIPNDPAIYRILINSKSPGYENNKISTSKYTWLNCFPKILLEQFSKMANIYFLLIAIMQVNYSLI